MRPFHRLAAGLAATLLAAPAPQAGANPRLGPDPVLGGGEYSTGGGLTVAVELREMNGRTGLCGVWAQSRRLTVYVRRAGHCVLSKGTIALDDRVLTHDLGFLKRVAPAHSYAGAPAGCGAAGLALGRGFAAGASSAVFSTAGVSAGAPLFAPLRFDRPSR